MVADDLDVALFDTLTGMPSVPQGRSFRLMFDTTPLCCPSKTSILRGQYSHSHGVLRNNPPDGGLARALELGLESSTVATWLDQAGYETGFIGRYLLGYGRRDTDAGYIPPGWDHWAARISSIEEGYEDAEFSIDGKPTRLPGNVDTAALELARGMIADAGDRPYFVMIATQAPHWPWPVRNDPTTRGQTMPPVEDLVEQLLSEVGSDTYVIFTSDNGFHLTPTAGKSLPYDTDTMVPLVVWGPDVRAGRRRRPHRGQHRPGADVRGLGRRHAAGLRGGELAGAADAGQEPCVARSDPAGAGRHLAGDPHEDAADH